MKVICPSPQAAITGHDDAATDPPLDGVTAKAMLSDQQDPLLPIYRLSPDDPDEENTLATAIFTLSATRVVWQVFTLDRENAVLQGSV